MNKKIYFIESSSSFDSSFLNSPEIGGAEKTLINITTELAKDVSLDIKVFNNINTNTRINNVSWNNIKNIDKKDIPDTLISMSDANLLTLINSKKKFLWSHSVQPFEKFLRKNQLTPFIKNKPKMLLEGDYHYKTRSFLTSFYGKSIVELAPDYDFIKTKVNMDVIPTPKAIFTTRSDRNLTFLLDCWSDIAPRVKNCSLYINPPFLLSDRDISNSVFLRTKSSKEKLILDLLSSRVMLNPGHKGEVYCLAAEEARELCLPIVTMGIGSLYERVKHNVTGFIAKNKTEFINYAHEILFNDETYMRFKKNLFNMRGNRTYKNCSEDLLKIINET